MTHHSSPQEREGRAFPPDFCDEATMAYCVGLAQSTFREYVAAGFIPPPVKIGNKSRWHRAAVVDALAGRAAEQPDSRPDIMGAARGDGQTTKARRHAA